MSDKDLQELNAVSSVLSSHIHYKFHAVKTIVTPKKLKYEALPPADKALIGWFPDYLDSLSHSIQLNDSYFGNVAREMAPYWCIEPESQWASATQADVEKMNGLMAQYVREWSELGATQREQSMRPILDACEEIFPSVSTRPNRHVLVPGAGLGRLVVEFVKRGFSTQGNDISYHMLLNSNFILNNTYCENQYVICPFLNKSSHMLRRTNQLRQVYFPDLKPGDISLLNRDYPDIQVEELMSMVAGGFVDLYGPPDMAKLGGGYSDEPSASEFRHENKGRFDVVATCFFLDTSTNIIDTLRAIKHTLKDDGYWINFGPLLWHFENNDEVSMEKIKVQGEWKDVPVPLKGLELSRDDLLELIEKMGFTFKEHRSGIETTYGCETAENMGRWNYKCEFWVCQKTCL